MKATILGSGSDGNCYVFHNSAEALIVDCGCSLRKVLEVVHFNRLIIVGLFITHEHGDHCKYIKEFIKAHIPIYMSRGTANAIEDKYKIKSLRYTPCVSRNDVDCGCFHVISFLTVHDAAEPLGFYIEHEEIGAMIIAEDTAMIRDKFSALDYIFIECNYSKVKLLNNERYTCNMKERITNNHMSYSHCMDAILHMDLSVCKKIVLLHLSNDNSDEKAFTSGINIATGIRTIAARAGMEFSINKSIF
jgi:phosphoribosyl 1,2-cyclic phosphodiesterase